jgi:hypothetical protein
MSGHHASPPGSIITLKCHRLETYKTNWGLFCQLCFLDSLKQITIKNIIILNPATKLVLPTGDLQSSFELSAEGKQGGRYLQQGMSQQTST